MSNRHQVRVIDAQGFILHTTAWRETSVIAKVFAREHGVLLVAAKGAKRPFSGLRTILQSFQPLLLSWSGRGEVRTLTHAETQGILLMPSNALMSGWYMNELILKLVAREDAHPVLYDAYAQALARLASGYPQAMTLRRFEWVLLRESGYGMDGPLPDFEDPAQAESLRLRMRKHLEEYLPDVDLMSRKVMMGLRQQG